MAGLLENHYTMTRELGGQLRDDWEDCVNWTYGISWHILASWTSNLELLSSWVSPEVRVPTAWYTVRGTGLPINSISINVIIPAWFILLRCFFSSCHFVVPNTKSDCTILYIVLWLTMIVSIWCQKSMRMTQDSAIFPAPILILMNSPHPIQNLAFSWGGTSRESRLNMRLVTVAVEQLHKIKHIKKKWR